MSGSRRVVENPPQRNAKIGADFIASSMQENFFFGFFYRFIGAGKLFSGFFYRFIGAGKLFSGFFYSFIGAGKLFFGFFYRFIGAGKLFFGFFYRFIGKKTLPYKIVSLYSIFFLKIVCQYRFNRYIFEYRCPSL